MRSLKCAFDVARVVAPLAAALILGSCAEERPPINRVQAEALAKSFFVGPDLTSTADDPEFYKRGTVVDVDYGAAQDGLFTASYAQPMARVRWEITENTLNARLSYERISGTDGKGNQYNGVQPKATNDGQVVASYKIESHFDIKREYNPQTGEELNVIGENTTDRPWYERAYFRVDWSQNLITTAYDYDTLSQIGIYGAVKYEPFAYTVLDPQSPDAPHFVPEEGYFDVTNKTYATPETLDLAAFGLQGSIPTCFLPVGEVSGGSYPYGNCNPTQLTIRESYRLVTDTDYEAANFDGVRFQAIGAFNFDYRRGYARNYGLLDQEWSRFIARYNIWQKSHVYNGDKPIACATKETTEDPTGDPSADPNRDTNGDGTADECSAAGSGSRCDVYTQKCTLPYRQRKTRTIPWYIAGDTSLYDPTNWAALEWDLAMKTAVQTSRLVECRKTGGGAACDQMFPMWKGQQEDNEEAVRISRVLDACRRKNQWMGTTCEGDARAAAAAVATERGAPGDVSTLAIGEIAAMPPIIVLCHNPVTSDDHPACGKAGLAVRTGDIRYNTVQNIQTPQTPSPWGIMVDGNDPLTGEKVVGSINLWTAVTDGAAQSLVDMVRYINGEITTDQITNGTYVQDWAAGARLGASGALPAMSAREIDQRLASGSALEPAQFRALAKSTPGPQIQAVLDAGRAQVADVQARNDVASPSLLKVQATLNLGQGTPVANQLINAPMLQLAGLAANTAATSVPASVVSPMGVSSPLLWDRVRQARENALASRGACVLDEAPEPTSLTAVAAIMAKKFPPAQGESASAQQDRYQRMFHYIQRRYQYGVIAHEMGHSIGLRHNFVSSSASLFYRPQYWQLRTKNGKVQTACTDVVADGATCVGPRYWDPFTDEEQSQMIETFMQSTVMEYPGETSQDMMGLGVTDFAAARFFYGDNVSVYTNAMYNANTAVGGGITAATDTFGGLVGIQYGLAAAGRVTNFHYSQLQKNYQLLTACNDANPQQPAGWDESVDGKWDQVMDGLVVSIDGKPTKCRSQQVDYIGYGDLTVPAGMAQARGGPSVDAKGRTRVPYGFASDNWADTGNASVFRFDNGADPYEQVQHLVSTQENRHIFDNYRRNRTTFSLIGAAQRSFSRYNVKLQGLAGGVGFLQSIYRDIATNQGYSFDTLWPFVVQDQVHENMIAATVAFDHFVRELGRPEPGAHYTRAPAFADPVFHSATDPDDYGPPAGGIGSLGQAMLIIPNGTAGFLHDVGFGGHPLENALSTTNGDFDVDYIENAGSYYDKINTALLLAESEDRFISQSRRDFYDARFRAIGMADVVPDGFRRVIANSLTGDRSLLAPRIAATATGQPILNTGAPTALDPLAARYPKSPMGWPSFWPKNGPEICFATGGRNACTNYAGDGNFDPSTPASSVAVDPQIGWEVQKFLMVWTVALIKANEKTNWTDMMRIWRLGQNASPEIDQRIEWQDPTSGEIYYARDFGTECLFGDAANACAGGTVVQKGIAARVLEYANQLTARGYKLDTLHFPATGGLPAGFNALGRAMVLRQPSGDPIVVSDPAVQDIASDGNTLVPTSDCDQNLTPACKPLVPSQNHSAYELQSYKSVPDYLWQAEAAYGWFDPPSTRGTF
ncbi:MAG TPA: zinc-dependent metalloprotease [Polyangia bacterium]|nr:zinc-dependent metalloprotease [Polyangia bacterium]